MRWDFWKHNGNESNGKELTYKVNNEITIAKISLNQIFKYFCPMNARSAMGTKWAADMLNKKHSESANLRHT